MPMIPIHSTTEQVHLARMCSIIQDIKAQKIAELGTHIGGSLIAFAVALQTVGGGEVYAIDHRADLLERTRSNFELNKHAFPDVTLHLYEGACPEAIALLPENLDFVFIDDLHDGEHVAKEIDLLLPKMNIGGVIAGHDTKNPPAIGDAFTTRGGTLFPAGYGLGVIYL